MYAAFGNKEELFHRAVARYAEADMAYACEALAQPTAYAVTETFLHANADAGREALHATVDVALRAVPRPHTGGRTA
ncbi:hypothetical protein AB0N31_03195 [Streptomyces sp. NPDC051051]|uniref:hypothetical protein n=1 Tax=Streptomyces sp. NPDC051051 TaxID=3155666 RepID=UPI00342F695E